MGYRNKHEEECTKRLFKCFDKYVRYSEKHIGTYYQIGVNKLIFIDNKNFVYEFTAPSGKATILGKRNYSFGERLANIIDDSYWSWDEVMWRSEIPTKEFKKYIKGFRYPTDEDMQKLADAIECDIEDLI